MDPLIKTTLHRTLAFLFLALLSPLLFVYVEYKETNDVEEKYKMLRLLYDSMASKCNITIEEFNNFSKLANHSGPTNLRQILSSKRSLQLVS